MSWFKYVWIIMIILFWLFMTSCTVWDIATSVKKHREYYPDESLFNSIDDFNWGWIALNIAVLFTASLICGVMNNG